jgi:UDP-N-acetylglucosamine--N-acetylmuramyl-(pentapeptide) pyrophosphoryl-undecaprenol N-acetylglucosamine transferase
MMFSSPITQFGSGTIMVMAGGTGGHVYPAIAVADYMKDHGWNIVWLCTEGGMENKLIEGKQYKKAMITMRGVRGNGLLGWVLLPVKLMTAFAQSISAIRQHQPNVVLGMGGFAAFPGGLMAKLLGKPLVIHEQNSIAGLTNKVLAHYANKTLSAFKLPAENGYITKVAQLVGNPLRADMTQITEPAKRFANRTGALNLLVVGGSLGAQALNSILPEAIAKLPVAKRPNVTHQAGVKMINQLKQNYAKAAAGKQGFNIDCRPYIDNMADEYAKADLVICRAGAMTVAELSCIGVASILVPFPHAVDDHQTTNTADLVDAGAAILIPQSLLDAETLAAVIGDLTRDDCLQKAIKARQLGKPKATESVAKICMEVAR